MDAMDWNVTRFTATSPRREGSEKCPASNVEGPRLCALYVSNPTSLSETQQRSMERTSKSGDLAHPTRYSQEMPYAAVTNLGLTMGRNASPTSLVC